MLWMRAYGWPLLFTVLIHLGVGWILLVGWHGEQAFSQPVSKPSLIKATVVELPKSANTQAKKKASTPVQKKTAPKKPVSKPQPKPAPKPTPKPVATKPVETITTPAEKVTPKPQPTPVVSPPVTPPLDIDLSEELAAEDAAREAESEQALVNSYIAKIMAQVESAWSRPPSARNGMQAVLVVNLIPTGEVVNVSLAETSGNAAFDTSAVNAVYRVERFDDLRGMTSAMFEANFRRFRLIFKPEDLRL
ncbi:MAG TPA: TonB C-terminal domain-containing protein [Pseudomonadales bacterium]|nr:TonB C-terminal domain-containing protein [Pseudomonadales bacterium]